MAVYRVEAEAGWGGIAARLAEARPGDRIELAPARFEGADTLRVPGGVTLAGLAGHDLAYIGEGVAVLVEQAAGTTLERLNVTGYAGLADESDPDEALTVGLIRIADSRAITVADCRVAAGARRRSCVSVEASHDVKVSRCHVSGARRGVVFWNSTGDVHECEAERGFRGIQLSRYPATTGAGSRATLSGNRCHDNAECGILLRSSEGEAIVDNRCWNNGINGIELVRDAAEQPSSRAVLRGNHCHDNAECGIVLRSSEGEAIVDNRCWNNGMNGIALVREADEQPSSRAVMRGNHCHDNAGSGIGVWSCEGAVIEANECGGNTLHGIILQRSGPAGAPAEAALRANRCHDNGECGIVLLSSESPGIEGNECWGNAFHGIALVRQPDCTAPSRAILRGNNCNRNRQGGILLASSESEVIQGNECCDNGVSGILLQRHPECGDMSRATIIGNRCDSNGENGIFLLSGESAAISENTCSMNGLHGILLERDASGGMPSRARIVANRCSRNTQSGIVLFASESDGIEGNESWGNQFYGIAVERGLDGLHPSRAVLRANWCHSNGQAGILLRSSESEAIEGNECRGNTLHGIQLSPQEGRQCASSAVLRFNRCHDNGQSGIALASCNSSAIQGNLCWGNAFHGIVLATYPNCDLPSRAVVQANHCHDNGQSGIGVFSSVGEAITENLCWNNHLDGITIDRDGTAAGASVAMLRGNRCQGNGQAGIQFIGSTGGARGNRFKGNRIDGVEHRPQPGSFAQVPAPTCADNAIDQTMDLPAARLAQLKAVLPSDDRIRHKAKAWSRTGLAEFLSTACSGCFRHFWIGYRRTPVVGEQPSSSRAAGLDPRHWVLELGDPAHPKLHPATLPENDVIEAVLARIERWRLARGALARTRWLAFVSPEESDLDSLVTRLDAQAALRDGAEFSAGMRMALPVTVAMGAGAPPLREGLAAALMGGRSPLRERLGVLWHSHALRWLLAALLAAGAAIALFDLWPLLKPRLKAAATLAWMIENGQFAWKAALGWAISALALAGLLVLMLMPRHLRARPDGLLAGLLSDGSSSALRRIADAISSRLFPSWRDRLARRADRLWLLRRLFARGDFAVLVLSDVVAWQDDDLAWLRSIAASVPEGKALATLLHLDERMMLRPLLVEPQDAPWAGDVHLFLHDEEARVRIGREETMSEDALDPALAALFAPVSPGELRTSIALPPFTPVDLLPTLPLASAPTSRLVLSRPQTSDIMQQRPLVTELIPAAADFFEGNLPDLAAVRTDPLFASGPTASAVRLSEERRARIDYHVLTGRLCGRKLAGTALTAIWPDGSDWEEYVAAALRFGIWLRADRLAAALTPAGGMKVEWLAAVREFEAMVFLGQDLQVVLRSGCPVHGAERYARGWEALTSAIRALPAGEQHGHVVSRFLAAARFCAPVSSLADEFAATIRELALQDSALASFVPVSACEQFCHEVALEVVRLRQLQGFAREHRLAELRLGRWRAWPEALDALVERESADAAARATSLAEMFAAAPDEAAIERLVRLHAALPVRTVFALAAAAVSHVLEASGRDVAEPTPDAGLAQIGANLVALRTALLMDRAEPEVAAPSGDFARDAAGARTGGAAAAALMSQPGSAARIATWLAQSPERRLEAIEARLLREALAAG